MLDSLHAHVRAVRGNELFGDGIDFKLAASGGAASDQAAAETGFKSLSVALCEVSCLWVWGTRQAPLLVPVISYLNSDGSHACTGEDADGI